MQRHLHRINAMHYKICINWINKMICSTLNSLFQSKTFLGALLLFLLHHYRHYCPHRHHHFDVTTIAYISYFFIILHILFICLWPCSITSFSRTNRGFVSAVRILSVHLTNCYLTGMQTCLHLLSNNGPETNEDTRTDRDEYRYIWPVLFQFPSPKYCI